MVEAEFERAALGASAPELPPAERFDRLVLLARKIFGTDIVAVELIEDHRQITKAISGAEPRAAALTRACCRYTIEQEAILEVRDLRQDARFDSDPSVTGPPHLRFYAGAPLRARSGQRGSLCVVGSEPRVLSARERAILRDLAEIVERELAFETDLVRAAAVQRSLLPRCMPDLPGLDIAGCMRPSRYVGGDFFDWQVISSTVNTDGIDRVQVMVADVAGKGLPAALLAAGLRGVFRAHSTYTDLGRAVSRTQLETERELADTNSFVTLWSARVDPQTGALEYLDAGHGLAVIVSPDARARPLTQSNPPLGVPWEDLRVTATDRLGPQEFLLVVSDGILDVFPDVDTALARARAVVEQFHTSRELAQLVTRFAADNDGCDDVTALVVRPVKP